MPQCWMVGLENSCICIQPDPIPASSYIFLAAGVIDESFVDISKNNVDKAESRVAILEFFNFLDELCFVLLLLFC